MNEARIKREVKLKSAENIDTFGQISIETYNKPAVKGLHSYIIQPLMCLEHEPSSPPSAVALDNLWVFGYVLYTDQCPSWSGFIKVVMRNERYGTSRLLTLPFINLDPGNISTYTLLYTFRKLSVRSTACEYTKLHLISHYI